MRSLHNFRPRLILIHTLAFLIFAGPAVTLQWSVRASGDPAPRRKVSRTAKPSQIPACEAPERKTKGMFDAGRAIELPLVPVHLSVLPNGKLLFWGRDKNMTDPLNPKEVVGKSDAYVWDPASITTLPDGRRIANTTYVPNSTTNLFCSGHSFLPDGRLLVSGGHRQANFDGDGERHINIFNYSTNPPTWVRGPDMNLGRWYPYNVTLGTGETMIVSGTYWATEPNPPTSSADFNSNFVPQLYMLEGFLRDVATVPSPLANYPYLHLSHDGQVFYAGPTRSRIFNPDANRGAGSWTDMGSISPRHTFGSSVLYDSNGKVLMMGGLNSLSTPIADAKIIDLTVNDPTLNRPKWEVVSSMNFPRIYHTATVLPDGKVLVTGGTRCKGANHIDSDDGTCVGGQIMTPEMWDPATKSWSIMAQQSEIRVYHSTAVLLPDARVLVAGSGLPGAVGEFDDNGNRINNLESANARIFGHKKVEIYMPPYLFTPLGCLASRPVISFAPPTISYGQRFSINASGIGSSATASLVRLPSVTHGFNQDQRVVFLTDVVVTGTGLQVTAPADANKCPPGYYMLFVMNAAGVPSVSKIIRVTQDQGNVDGIDGHQIWGWAWDRNNPNTPINVNIYEGNSLLATVPANIFRQDLVNAGKGNGVHGFVYTFPPNQFKDGLKHPISVKFANSSTNLTTNHLNLSPRLLACAALFPTQVPATTAGGGGSTWEQGTEFSASVSGAKITHVRFYKAPGETGTHVGRIWTATGTPLAQVTFTNETASGWQTQALPTPITMTQGVRYKVSYNVNSIVAKTFNTFTSPVTNGPLTAWGASFSTPGGSFPNTGSTSNLFADVLVSLPR
jgi:hypothetical protein